MVICSLGALKKPSKKKNMGIGKEIAKVLHQASGRRKKGGKEKIGMIKFLALTLLLLARLALALTSAFVFIDCF